MTDVAAIAAKLTKAQRQYLVELELNSPRPGLSEWQEGIEAEFHNKGFRKAIRRPGLDTAWALIRKGVVKRSPQPTECGFHYASLTPLGLAVRAILLEQQP